ncbi:MAG: Holliday junction branch migration protein RuvA [Bacteroidales bacterium]|jgi:Holliday junction DNA helicase RuvA|nr:Holliday junction branch migration protein RuvA [Bacteroidales bacterium]
MYEYIKGKITDLNPSFAVLENQGIGYFLHISVNTFTELKDGQEALFWIHHAVREDAEQLFGFTTKKERELFRLLITVTGVGANTARMMLSTMSPDQITSAIQQDDVITLKSIKGIGAKTAQRIIIDLRDKISDKILDEANILSPIGNTIQNEAFEALAMLGFGKKQIENALKKVIAKNPDVSVEELVKLALKQL